MVRSGGEREREREREREGMISSLEYIHPGIVDEGIKRV